MLLDKGDAQTRYIKNDLHNGRKEDLNLRPDDSDS